MINPISNALPTDQIPFRHLGGLVRKLLPVEIHLARNHLLRLDGEARQRRFSHNVSDDYVASYAAKLGDVGNLNYAFFIDGDVKAMAELKRPRLSWGTTAEAAFSVERDYANRGLATLMMGRIIRSARNRGIHHLQLYCMADNAKMQAIARHYDGDLHIEEGAIIADIVPARFDYVSVMMEMFEDRVAFAHSFFDMQKRIVRTLRA